MYFIRQYFSGIQDKYTRSCPETDEKHHNNAVRLFPCLPWKEGKRIVLRIFAGGKHIRYMDTRTFITRYREAFGEAAPLPLVFFYSDHRKAATEKVPGCFLKYLRQAFDGQPVCLDSGNITCGGGRFYAGFTPMPDHVPVFVSQKEKYKESPGLIKEYLDFMGPVPAQKKFLNFVRADQAESFDGMEGLLFIASPDVISGLCAWAFFDRNDPETVSLVFGSGCSSIVANAARENARGGFRTFVGLTDPSARQWFDEDVFSFVIPACRFGAMAGTMDRCCFSDTAGWSRIRSRINAVRRAVPAWAEEMNCAITVCDAEGTILYMNAMSRETYIKYGDLTGRNLMDCHGERSKGIIRKLIETGGQNVYTKVYRITIETDTGPANRMGTKKRHFDTF